MKKLLVVLLMLGVVSGLFAQMTFGGLAGTGLLITFPNDGDHFVSPFSGSVGAHNYFFRLVPRYRNPAGTVGLQMLVDSGWSHAGNLYLQDAHLYMTPEALGFRTTFRAGLIENDEFVTGISLDVLSRDLGEGNGIQIIDRHINNLVLGLGIYATPTWEALQELKLRDIKYTFNAIYTIPQIGRVFFGIRPENQFSAGSWRSINPNSDARAILGADIIRLQGVKLALDADFRFLSDFSDNGRIDIRETVGYSFSDLGLTVQLTGAHFFPVNNTMVTYYEDVAHLFWFFAQYDRLFSGNVVPRLDAQFLYGASLNQPEIQRTPQTLNTNFRRDYYELMIQSLIRFNIAGPSCIELGYRLLHRIPPQGESTTTQWVYAGFKVEF